MKNLMTGMVADILGDKSPRQVARMIDKRIIKGKMTTGKKGRDRRSWRIVSRATLMKYIEAHCPDNEKAFIWLLGQKIDDFLKRVSQAEEQQGFIGRHAGLAEGIRAIALALRPDTPETLDPLSSIVLGELYELMGRDRRRRILKVSARE